ncbi:hypothetical protein BDQ12DRAFT_166518 [Crucibulum laeve]|uniref:Uncharacterized protein n=1 Tax=Crucibulum laeve TaxID=68775 RepID=A0A5C3MEP3_9AGAR|nr:hypothetical protein BDQ12DRAFT_166518 [Crucibulum laeve]
MLLAFIGLIISLTVTTEINCRALYTFNSWTGNMAILCASTSLMLRTIALWERKRMVVMLLGFLCVCHWALLYRTMFIVVAEWEPTVKACVVTQTNPAWLNTTFFFTMGFDFIILCFTGFALFGRHSARTDLWKLLFHDGLVYFLISFSTNCIPAVLNVLNLNTIMNVIATIPAATITSIASCRAVIRLLEFSSSEIYVHSTSIVTSSHGARHSIVSPTLPKFQKFVLTRPEVHVMTEHITMSEFSPADSESPYAKEHTSRKVSFDLESARDTEPSAAQDEKESYDDGYPRTV